MAEVTIIDDFGFEDFLLFNRVYKSYVRKKGGALIEIEAIDSQGEERVKTRLDKEMSMAKNIILVFKVENKLYNIPVVIDTKYEADEESKDNQKHHILKKSGKAICIEERRDYERVEIDKRVEYYSLNNKPQHFYKGVLKDISASGAKLVTKRNLNTKYPLLINVFFMNIGIEKLKSKIVWKEKKGNKFYNGLQFVFANEIDKEKLIDYLY